MLNSRLLPAFLVPFGILSVGFGCSSGGTDVTDQVMVPGAGGSSSAAGSGAGGSGTVTSAGSGTMPGSAGSVVATGGDTSGQAGTTGTAGTAGSTGSSGGMTGAGGSAGGAGGSGGSGGADPNANKVMLYDGSAATFNAWVKRFGGGTNPWTNNADGTMTVKTGQGDIISNQKFQDVFIHVEYKTPMMPSNITGQERGNSGVYLKTSYELQVLDTYGQAPANNGCGAIYGVAAPLTVACFQEEMWNTYEAEFKAQVCNAEGQKTANAKFTMVKLNGTIVHENVDVPGRTEGGENENCEPRGVLLQDHSSNRPVSFRNIWVTPRN